MGNLEEQLYADWYADKELQLKDMFKEGLSLEQLRQFAEFYENELLTHFEEEWEEFKESMFDSDMETRNER